MIKDLLELLSFFLAVNTEYPFDILFRVLEILCQEAFRRKGYPKVHLIQIEDVFVIVCPFRDVGADVGVSLRRQMNQLCSCVKQNYPADYDRAEASSDCIDLIATLDVEARYGLAKDVETF